VTARQRPCRDCGDAIVLARSPHGGWIPLQPYPDAGPDATGRIRVDVLAAGLVVLRADEPTSGRTKRYARHDCVTARKAVPRSGRPKQLALEPP
jgi:hypothetical protein